MYRFKLIFLQSVVILCIVSLCGLAGIAISVLTTGIRAGFSFNLLTDKPGYFILLAGLLAWIPAMISLVHGLRILHFLKAGALLHARIAPSFQIIQRCFNVISILAIGLFPVLFVIADQDDAPGIILFAFVLILIPLSLSAVSSVMETLLKKQQDHMSNNFK